jgi:hypothetical protein
MKHPYPANTVRQIIQAQKCVREGEVLEVKKRGEHGAGFNVNLDLADGPFTDIRYLGHTHDVTDIKGSEASLILAAQRVRGVGHNAIGRRRFYKDRIPAGWHQNVIDPQLATGADDYNRHEPLPDFMPTDFKDFIRKTATIWNIDLEWEDMLL